MFHDQSDDIVGEISRYERCLAENGPPDVAFHFEPLLNGHKGYEGLTVERRKTSIVDYRLEQAADCLCTIELAAIKYAAKEDGETYNKFFGGIGAFKKSWLKQARRMAI